MRLLWHTGCNHISDVEYETSKLVIIFSTVWLCVLKYNLDKVPFTRCDNSELNNINISNSMRFLESLPNVEIVNEATQFSDVSSNEASIKIPSKSCSNYHSVADSNLLNIRDLQQTSYSSTYWNFRKRRYWIYRECRNWWLSKIPYVL